MALNSNKRSDSISVGYPSSWLSVPFCDREKEADELARDAENFTNVVLSSPRRYGKTFLVKRVQSRPSAMRAWPGNVRELKNVITRAALLCEGEILASHLGLGGVAATLR